MAKTQQIKIDCSIQEVWSKVPDYANYEASSLGRIRSITHLDSMGRERKGVIKKFKRHRNGYLLVCLNHKDIELVHRVVVKTFIGEIKDGLEVNHKDGDKSNNSILNLELCTKSYNQIHRCHILKNMPDSQLKGISDVSKKRSVDVRGRVSKDMIESDCTLNTLSCITGVSKATLSRMRNGR